MSALIDALASDHVIYPIPHLQNIVKLLGHLLGSYIPGETLASLYPLGHVSLFWINANITSQLPLNSMKHTRYSIIQILYDHHWNFLFIDNVARTIDRFDSQYKPIYIDIKFLHIIQCIINTYFFGYVYDNHRSENHLDYVQDFKALSRRLGSDNRCEYYGYLYCKYRLAGLPHYTAYQLVLNCSLFDIKELVQSIHFRIPQY